MNQLCGTHPALRWRKKDVKSKPSLGYIARLYFKKKFTKL
jgi:hypothetical protein